MEKEGVTEEKVKLSEEELLQIANDRLAAACPGCSIKTVYPLDGIAPETPDWTFSIYSGPSESAEAVRQTLEPLRSKYSLSKSYQTRDS